MDTTAPGSGDFPPIPDDREAGPPDPPGCDGYGTTAREPRGAIVVGEAPIDACAPRAHFVVPPGDLFVLGDNRANSHDSRAWGTVPGDHVLGRVIGIWWSRSSGRIHWGRIGDL